MKSMALILVLIGIVISVLMLFALLLSEATGTASKSNAVNQSTHAHGVEHVHWKLALLIVIVNLVVSFCIGSIFYLLR